MKEINDERRKVITDYIRDNQGCTIESVVHDPVVSSKASRVKVYKIINELKTSDILSNNKEKANSRNSRLFVNESNLILRVNEEITAFAADYSLYLVSITHECEKLKNFQYASSYKHPNYPRTPADYVYAASWPLTEFIRLYLLKAVLLWPRKSKEENIRAQLHSILFSRVNDMLTELARTHESIKSLGIRAEFNGYSYGPGNLDSKMIRQFFLYGLILPNSKRAREKMRNLEKLGITETSVAVMANLTNIATEIVRERPLE